MSIKRITILNNLVTKTVKEMSSKLQNFVQNNQYTKVGLEIDLTGNFKCSKMKISK